MNPSTMFARRAVTGVVGGRLPRPAIASSSLLLGRRVQVRRLSKEELEDPDMNGGYISPPAEKRQFRDPYADWWDKQERRNYGEPLHEDEDILGRLSPEEYTHASPGKAVFQLFFFVGAVFGLAGIVSMLYPDKPALPRTFPDGLESELGGPGAVRAKKEGETW